MTEKLLPGWRVTGLTYNVRELWHLPIGGGSGPGMYPGASSYTLPHVCAEEGWSQWAGDPEQRCTADEVPA